MRAQQSETTHQEIDGVWLSAGVFCAALLLMSGADTHANVGDRFRCIPADGSAPYTSPGSCRSNTDGREPLTEQEKADAWQLKIVAELIPGAQRLTVDTVHLPSMTNVHLPLMFEPSSMPGGGYCAHRMTLQRQKPLQIHYRHQRQLHQLHQNLPLQRSSFHHPLWQHCRKI